MAGCSAFIEEDHVDGAAVVWVLWRDALAGCYL